MSSKTNTFKKFYYSRTNQQSVVGKIIRISRILIRFSLQVHNPLSSILNTKSSVNPELTWHEAVYSLCPLTICTVYCRNNTVLLMGCCSQTLQQCIWFIYCITFLKSIKFWVWSTSGCKGSRLGILELYHIITTTDILPIKGKSVSLEESHHVNLTVTKHCTWKGP